MIDWEQVRRERRMKVATVPARDVEAYMLIEELPAETTMSTHDLPAHWLASGVVYDISSSSFWLIVISPEFEQVPPGAEMPTIAVTRQLVRVVSE